MASGEQLAPMEDWFGFAELTVDVSRTDSNEIRTDSTVCRPTTPRAEDSPQLHEHQQNAVCGSKEKGEIIVPIISKQFGFKKFKVLARQKAEEDEDCNKMQAKNENKLNENVKQSEKLVKGNFPKSKFHIDSRPHIKQGSGIAGRGIQVKDPKKKLKKVSNEMKSSKSKDKARKKPVEKSKTVVAEEKGDAKNEHVEDGEKDNENKHGNPLSNCSVLEESESTTCAGLDEISSCKEAVKVSGASSSEMDDIHPSLQQAPSNVDLTKCSVSLKRDPSIDNIQIAINEDKSECEIKASEDLDNNENHEEVVDTTNGKEPITCSCSTEEVKQDMVFDVGIDLRKSGRLKSSKCASRYRGDYGIRAETYTKLLQKIQSPSEIDELDKLITRDNDVHNSRTDMDILIHSCEDLPVRRKSSIDMNTEHSKRRQRAKRSVSGDKCKTKHKLAPKARTSLDLTVAHNMIDVKSEKQDKCMCLGETNDNISEMQCEFEESNTSQKVELSEINEPLGSEMPVNATESIVETFVECSELVHEEHSENPTMLERCDDGHADRISAIVPSEQNICPSEEPCDSSYLQQPNSSDLSSDSAGKNDSDIKSAQVVKCTLDIEWIDGVKPKPAGSYVHSVGKSVMKKQNQVETRKLQEKIVAQDEDQLSLVSSPGQLEPATVLENLRCKLFEKAGADIEVANEKPKVFECKLISSQIKSKVKPDEQSFVDPPSAEKSGRSTPQQRLETSGELLEEVAKTLDILHRKKRKPQDVIEESAVKKQKVEQKTFMLRSVMKRLPDDDLDCIQQSVDDLKDKKKLKLPETAQEILDSSENRNELNLLRDFEECKQRKVNDTHFEKESTLSKKEIKTNLNSENTKTKAKPKSVKCQACGHNFKTKDLMRKHYPCRIRQTRTWSQNKLRPKRALERQAVSSNKKFVCKLPKSGKHEKARLHLLTFRKTKFRRVKGKRRRKLYQLIQELIGKRKQTSWPHLKINIHDLSFKEQVLYKLGLVCVGNSNEGLDLYTESEHNVFEQHREKEKCADLSDQLFLKKFTKENLLAKKTEGEINLSQVMDDLSSSSNCDNNPELTTLDEDVCHHSESPKSSDVGVCHTSDTSQGEICNSTRSENQVISSPLFDVDDTTLVNGISDVIDSKTNDGNNYSLKECILKDIVDKVLKTCNESYSVDNINQVYDSGTVDTSVTSITSKTSCNNTPHCSEPSLLLQHMPDSESIPFENHTLHKLHNDQVHKSYQNEVDLSETRELLSRVVLQVEQSETTCAPIHDHMNIEGKVSVMQDNRDITHSLVCTEKVDLCDSDVVAPTEHTGDVRQIQSCVGVDCQEHSLPSDHEQSRNQSTTRDFVESKCFESWDYTAKPVIQENLLASEYHKKAETIGTNELRCAETAGTVSKESKVHERSISLSVKEQSDECHAKVKNIFVPVQEHGSTSEMFDVESIVSEGRSGTESETKLHPGEQRQTDTNGNEGDEINQTVDMAVVKGDSEITSIYKSAISTESKKNKGSGFNSKEYMCTTWTADLNSIQYGKHSSNNEPTNVFAHGEPDLVRPQDVQSKKKVCAETFPVLQTCSKDNGSEKCKVIGDGFVENISENLDKCTEVRPENSVRVSSLLVNESLPAQTTYQKDGVVIYGAYYTHQYMEKMKEDRVCNESLTPKLSNNSDQISSRDEIVETHSQARSKSKQDERVEIEQNQDADQTEEIFETENEHNSAEKEMHRDPNPIADTHTCHVEVLSKVTTPERFQDEHHDNMLSVTERAKTPTNTDKSKLVSQSVMSETCNDSILPEQASSSQHKTFTTISQEQSPITFSGKDIVSTEKNISISVNDMISASSHTAAAVPGALTENSSPGVFSVMKDSCAELEKLSPLTQGSMDQLPDLCEHLAESSEEDTPPVQKKLSHIDKYRIEDSLSAGFKETNGPEADILPGNDKNKTSISEGDLENLTHTSTKNQVTSEAVGFSDEHVAVQRDKMTNEICIQQENISEWDKEQLSTAFNTESEDDIRIAGLRRKACLMSIESPKLMMEVVKDPREVSTLQNCGREDSIVDANFGNEHSAWNSMILTETLKTSLTDAVIEEETTSIPGKIKESSSILVCHSHMDRENNKDKNMDDLPSDRNECSNNQFEDEELARLNKDISSVKESSNGNRIEEQCKDNVQTPTSCTVQRTVASDISKPSDISVKTVEFLNSGKDLGFGMSADLSQDLLKGNTLLEDQKLLSSPQAEITIKYEVNGIIIQENLLTGDKSVIDNLEHSKKEVEVNCDSSMLSEEQTDVTIGDQAGIEANDDLTEEKEETSKENVAISKSEIKNPNELFECSITPLSIASVPLKENQKPNISNAELDEIEELRHDENEIQDHLNTSLVVSECSIVSFVHEPGESSEAITEEVLNERDAVASPPLLERIETLQSEALTETPELTQELEDTVMSCESGPPFLEPQSCIATEVGCMDSNSSNKENITEFATETINVVKSQMSIRQKSERHFLDVFFNDDETVKLSEKSGINRSTEDNSDMKPPRIETPETSHVKESIGRHFSDVMDDTSEILQMRNRPENERLTISKIKKLFDNKSSRHIFSKDALVKVRTGIEDLLAKVKVPMKSDPCWLNRNALSEYTEKRNLSRNKRTVHKKDSNDSSRTFHVGDISDSDASDDCCASDSVDESKSDTSSKGGITNNILQMLTSFETKGSIADNMTSLLDVLAENLGFSNKPTRSRGTDFDTYSSHDGCSNVDSADHVMSEVHAFQEYELSGDEPPCLEDISTAIDLENVPNEINENLKENDEVLLHGNIRSADIVHNRNALCQNGQYATCSDLGEEENDTLTLADGLQTKDASIDKEAENSKPSEIYEILPDYSNNSFSLSKMEPGYFESTENIIKWVQHSEESTGTVKDTIEKKKHVKLFKSITELNSIEADESDDENDFLNVPMSKQFSDLKAITKDDTLSEVNSDFMSKSNSNSQLEEIISSNNSAKKEADDLGSDSPQMLQASCDMHDPLLSKNASVHTESRNNEETASSGIKQLVNELGLPNAKSVGAHSVEENVLGKSESESACTSLTSSIQGNDNERAEMERNTDLDDTCDDSQSVTAEEGMVNNVGSINEIKYNATAEAIDYIHTDASETELPIVRTDAVEKDQLSNYFKSTCLYVDRDKKEVGNEHSGGEDIVTDSAESRPDSHDSDEEKATYESGIVQKLSLDIETLPVGFGMTKTVSAAKQTENVHTWPVRPVLVDEDSNCTVDYSDPIVYTDITVRQNDERNAGLMLTNHSHYMETFCETIAEKVKRKQRERQMTSCRARHFEEMINIHSHKERMKQISIFRSVMQQKKRVERKRQMSVPLEADQARPVFTKDSSVPKELKLTPCSVQLKALPMNTLASKCCKPCSVQIKKLDAKSIEILSKKQVGSYENQNVYEEHKPPIKVKINLRMLHIVPPSPFVNHGSEVSDSENVFGDDVSKGNNVLAMAQENNSSCYSDDTAELISDGDSSSRGRDQNSGNRTPIRLNLKELLLKARQVDQKLVSAENTNIADEKRPTTSPDISDDSPSIIQSINVKDLNLSDSDTESETGNTYSIKTADAQCVKKQVELIREKDSETFVTEGMFCDEVKATYDTARETYNEANDEPEDRSQELASKRDAKPANSDRLNEDQQKEDVGSFDQSHGIERIGEEVDQEIDDAQNVPVTTNYSVRHKLYTEKTEDANADVLKGSKVSAELESEYISDETEPSQRLDKDAEAVSVLEKLEVLMNKENVEFSLEDNHQSQDVSYGIHTTDEGTVFFADEIVDNIDLSEAVSNLESLAVEEATVVIEESLVIGPNIDQSSFEVKENGFENLHDLAGTSDFTSAVQSCKYVYGVNEDSPCPLEVVEELVSEGMDQLDGVVVTGMDYQNACVSYIETETVETSVDEKSKCETYEAIVTDTIESQDHASHLGKAPHSGNRSLESNGCENSCTLSIDSSLHSTSELLNNEQLQKGGIERSTTHFKMSTQMISNNNSNASSSAWHKDISVSKTEISQTEHKCLNGVTTALNDFETVLESETEKDKSNELAKGTLSAAELPVLTETDIRHETEVSPQNEPLVDMVNSNDDQAYDNLVDIIETPHETLANDSGENKDCVHQCVMECSTEETTDTTCVHEEETIQEHWNVDSTMGQFDNEHQGKSTMKCNQTSIDTDGERYMISKNEDSESNHCCIENQTSVDSGISDIVNVFRVSDVDTGSCHQGISSTSERVSQCTECQADPSCGLQDILTGDFEDRHLHGNEIAHVDKSTVDSETACVETVTNNSYLLVEDMDFKVYKVQDTDDEEDMS